PQAASLRLTRPQAGSSLWLRDNPQLFASLLKDLQPAEQHRARDALLFFQLLRRRAPVEADPPGPVAFRLLQERFELVAAASEREGLFYYHRLAHREAFERLDCIVHLAGLRIEVNCQEVEVVRDRLGNKPGRQSGLVEAPVDEPDR